MNKIILILMAAFGLIMSALTAQADTVNGDNVICNSSLAQTNSTGEIVAANQSNVIVKNGAITFSGTAVNFSMVKFVSCQNSVVKNIQFGASGAGLTYGLDLYGAWDLGGTGDVVRDNQFNYITGAITFWQSVGGKMANGNIINHSWGAINANASSGGNLLKNNVVIPVYKNRKRKPS